tara:strand:- start:712 stop:822 length:111 start_codon:yes stop_codon:yes gene_type:complete
MIMIKWIKKIYNKWKVDRLFKKRMKEIQKRDPFIYK